MSPNHDSFDNTRFQDSRLHAYLDGELSADERVAFERELEQSDELRAALAVLRGVDDAIGSLPATEPSEGFARRVTGAAKARKPMAVLLRFVPLAAAAALMFAVYPFHGEPTPRPDSAPEISEYLDYVWEDDDDVYDGLSPSEADVLEALDAT
ncbi:MAG: zf-HC2 domain-containing protein [Planctomycetota bacterium]